MPGDAAHVKSAKFVAVIGAVILFALGWDPIHIVATAALFMFSVMFLSPDLDLPGTEPMQRWGALRWGWLMFEKRIPHRSPWSHGWIRGWLTIQANFLAILVLILVFLRLCWIPLIEPLIAQGNEIIDELLMFHFSTEVITVLIWWVCVSAAAHWHHKILDTFTRN